MKIVMAHNFYRHPGGEDRVFADEVALLQGRGHTVHQFTLDNRSIDRRSRLGVLRDTFWNRKAAAEIRDLVRETGAEIAHFHNTFPLISPAAYYGARAAGAAVVQTLHNYRLLCPKGLFHRQGTACEDCLLKRVAWPAVRHGCVHGSRTTSAAAVAMLAAHRALGTWARAVDLFLTPTEFARGKFIEGGMPAEQIVTKSNFVHPDPGIGPGGDDYAVFVGRLTSEKGIDVLLEAWSTLEEPLRLVIVGDGPQADAVRRASDADARIQLLGWQDREEVFRIVGRAVCLVMPSMSYETFGLTIAEAMARGTPVVVSRTGAMVEAVEDGVSGRLCEPGNAADLMRKVREVVSGSPSRHEAMRRAAREVYVSRYTAESSYPALTSAYERALARRWSRSKACDAREFAT